jgi:hypothetical protein
MLEDPKPLALLSPQAGSDGTKWINLDITAAKRALELVALGKSLFEIEQDPSLPPAGTFIQWVMLYPDLARAYTTARELSGFMLEEEALFTARALRLNPQSSMHIKATEILINYLKWAAGKRNPQVFSDKAALNVTVPIQINTTLDLGETGGGGNKEFPNIYEMSATLENAVPLNEVPLDVLERELAEAEGRTPKSDPRKAKRGPGRPRKEARKAGPAREEAEPGE